MYHLSAPENQKQKQNIVSKGICLIAEEMKQWGAIW